MSASDQDPWKLLLTVLRHVGFVQDGLEDLAGEFRRRARVHDRSKLQADEWDGFVQINRAAREFPPNSPEYRDSLKSQTGPDGCITKHYSRNSHHPEYHDSVEQMGFLDIVEMVIDWNAAAKTYGTMTLRESLPHHRDRFGFTDAQWWLIEQVVEWLEQSGLA